MAATMDRTYSVSVEGMLGKKSGSKVLYDKLLKINAHKQFGDIADRAGSNVIKPEHVLCTVKALKDEVTFKTVDKHETASILIDMQYCHIVFVYEKVHVQEEGLADGDILIYSHENAEMQKREFDDVTLWYSTGLQDIQNDK